MTEREWLTAADPAAMLEEMPSPISDRKARLFAVACCMRLMDSLAHECRSALRVAEEFADGRVNANQLLASLRSLASLPTISEFDYSAVRAVRATLYSPELEPVFANFAEGTGYPFPSSIGKTEVTSYAGYVSIFVQCAIVAQATSNDANALRENIGVAEYETQRLILLDIVDNPFSFASQRFQLRQSTNNRLRVLANNIYEKRMWSEMPLLGELLREEGCDDIRAIDHCLSTNKHVRGCWLVDSLLGRA